MNHIRVGGRDLEARLRRAGYDGVSITQSWDRFYSEYGAEMTPRPFSRDLIKVELGQVVAGPIMVYNKQIHIPNSMPISMMKDMFKLDEHVAETDCYVDQELYFRLNMIARQRQIDAQRAFTTATSPA